MENIFSNPMTVAVIAFGIVLIMIVYRICFGNKFKIKNSKIDISTGDDPALSEDFGVPVLKEQRVSSLSIDSSIEFASKICDLKIEESNRINDAKESILEQQKIYAKKALKRINDDFCDSYRTTQTNKDTNYQQIFQILFDRDFSVLIDGVLALIKMNHLADKNDDEFQDYLQLNASSEISSLKRKCCTYGEPIDVRAIEELFKTYSSKFFDCIESSLENAKILSITKTKEMEKIYKKYEEKKMELLIMYFPKLTKEELSEKAKRL